MKGRGEKSEPYPQPSEKKSPATPIVGRETKILDLSSVIRPSQDLEP